MDTNADKLRVPPMLEAQSRRSPRVFGLHEQKLQVISAIFVILVALFLFLSLISESGGSNLIGRFGTLAYQVLTFIFGKYVAYVAPILALLYGLRVGKGGSFQKVPLRVIGLFGTAVSFCSLAAIRYADTDFRKVDGFRVGGALGNFLMHKDCLNLKEILGTTGSYLMFGAVLLVSIMLVTDSLLHPHLVRLFDKLSVLDPYELWDRILDRLRYGSDAEYEYEEEDEPVSSRASLAPGTVRVPVQTVGGKASGSGRTMATLAGSLRDDDEFSGDEGDPSAGAVVPAMARRPSARPAGDAGTGKIRTLPVMPVQPDTMDDDDLVTLAERKTAEMESKPYHMPGLELLKLPPRVEQRISKDDIAELSDTLEKTLGDFGISAQVVQVTQGPTVMRFELQPAPGVKVSRIVQLENDIAMCIKAESVRIIAPIPGKAAVGIEVPNQKRVPVFLREILATEAFRNHKSPLAFALGKGISGEPEICDLAAMPHLLIAGTTGSGKSVCLNSVICSILFRMQPDLVRFIMIDPKRVELNVYQAIPHLLAPVVCEPRKAAAALQWAIEQMEDRYKKLASLGVRNIDGYNAIVRSRDPHPKAIGRQLEYMPHIVIVVDELADLMIIARNEVEDSIIRLAQMSRAVGMHLIIATQRPSVNVITGIIKANFPSRVAFQVSSKVDSRTILDTNGAEALLGRGDMLFSPGGSPKPIRLQGCYVSDEEVERLADYVREQQKAVYVKQDFATQREIVADQGLALDGVDADDSSVAMPADGDDDGPDYSYRQERLDGRPLNEVLAAGSTATAPKTAASVAEDADAIDEELFQQAVKLILTHRKASVSMLQRKLKIGFARAGRLMDMVEEAGIVGPNVGSKVRDIIVDPDEYLDKMIENDDEGF